MNLLQEQQQMSRKTLYKRAKRNEIRLQRLESDIYTLF